MPGVRIFLQNAATRIALPPLYLIIALGSVFYLLVLSATAWMV